MTRKESWQEKTRKAGKPTNGASGHPAQPQGPRPSIQDLVGQQLGKIEHCGHAELLDMNLTPPSWLVDGIVIDEGMTLLGGKKKLGKSWLCLQIAQAIATGGMCLERTVTQGSVIYICLEDGRRRLKSRLEKQHSPHSLPITYYTRFPPLDGDGLMMLMELLDEQKPKLLILDTLAAAKTGKVDENAAGGMADIGNALRALAQMYKAGILAVHHHGKLIGGDPGDDLRGSSALAGAADVNLGLYREAEGHVLRGEGRDIEALSIRLTFDPKDTWCWQARSDQRNVAHDEADQDIIDAVRHLGQATASAVCAMTGKANSQVSDRLQQLAKAGILRVRAEEKEGRGRPRLLYSVTADEETF